MSRLGAAFLLLILASACSQQQTPSTTVSNTSAEVTTTSKDTAKKEAVVKKDTVAVVEKQKPLPTEKQEDILAKPVQNASRNGGVNEFETVVEQYLQTLRKSHRGDNAATLQAAQLQVRVYQLQDSLQEKAEKMDASSRARFDQQVARLIKVASEL